MRLGYNTNGLAHHSLPAALRLLAELGYESVAITIDHHALNPYAAGYETQLRDTQQLLAEFGLRSVIETGARFLLDPRQKHHPTLLSTKSAGRPLRIEFLRHAIDLAASLGSDCVSLWSGVLERGVPRGEGMDRLCESLPRVLDYANRRGMPIGFEPEPGMLIATMDSVAELVDSVDANGTDATQLGLTLDIGHLHCLGEPIVESIHRWSNRLVNVHIEDMRAGVHEHLMFGDGEINFPPVTQALQEVDYQGGVHVELSRHGHVGPEAARRALAFLRGAK